MRTMVRRMAWTGLSLLLGGVVLAADLTTPIATIKAVSDGGKGNVEAAAAWEQLIQSPPAELPAILAALDDCNPLAANYLRSAVETIADRAIQAKQPLPTQELEAFIVDTAHAPRPRRLAFDLLTQVDPSTPDRLIPGLRNDPSVEFRRDAVDRLLAAAAAIDATAQPAESKAAYLDALTSARDEDQVKACVAPLEKLGHKVDLPTHFGFLMDWHLIGPFDNTDKKGFAVAYPPETELDLQKKYVGKEGEIGWTKASTTDDYGTLDLTKAQAAHKGAVTYATTTFTSDKDQPVELRLGTPNAWKLWVNGELLFGRDEYHRGTAFDQYIVRANLKQGENTILLKVCQNEQKEDWAQAWSFQLRVCDSTGTAILSTTRPGAQTALLPQQTRN